MPRKQWFCEQCAGSFLGIITSLRGRPKGVKTLLRTDVEVVLVL